MSSVVVVSGANGVSVRLDEIAVVIWNKDRTKCSFWACGNNVPFHHFEPLTDDKIDIGEIDDVCDTVLRSSLEVMRKRFPS